MEKILVVKNVKKGLVEVDGNTFMVQAINANDASLIDCLCIESDSVVSLSLDSMKGKDVIEYNIQASTDLAALANDDPKVGPINVPIYIKVGDEAMTPALINRVTMRGNLFGVTKIVRSVKEETKEEYTRQQYFSVPFADVASGKTEIYLPQDQVPFEAAQVLKTKLFKYQGKNYAFKEMVEGQVKAYCADTESYETLPTEALKGSVVVSITNADALGLSDVLAKGQVVEDLNKLVQIIYTNEEGETVTEASLLWKYNPYSHMISVSRTKMNTSDNHKHTMANDRRSFQLADLIDNKISIALLK